MAFLLLESSRDEMLKPYYEMVVGNGNNISFGRFKSILLEHLANFGGLKNLSLASNYYLAGAARYYFNGDLTYNKDLALFHEYKLGRECETESNNFKDEWNEDICKRLNILILILRNAYIDTVGSQFEQPEDFGNMPLLKLLKKYNKKIESVIFGENKKEEEDKKYSTRVGNGYTFDIIYSQKDCGKYFNATSPGAWCITYSISNYNMYIKNHNIHYVIFAQDGWEKIRRVPNRKMWVDNGRGLQKPQDEYGNSLIALLQKNVNGEPDYITSRWNHGSSDSGPVEADHAYTKEEFMQITGVSEEDLMRIFKIWNENKEKRKKNTPSKIELNNAIRKLKEVQMRINGGDDPKKYFNGYTAVVGDGNNLRKGFYKCFYKSEENNKLYFCLMDNGRLCFDSVFESSSFHVTDCRSILPDRYVFYDSKTKRYIMYNYRKHSLLTVDGTSKFIEVPLDTSLRDNKPGDIRFYCVKKTKHDVALLDYNTDKPVILPNGEVWSACIIDDRYDSYRVDTASIYSKKYGIELEMIYDESSREKYFFNIETRKFFKPEPFKVTQQMEDEFHVSKWEPVISRIDGLDNNYVNLFCIEYKSLKNVGSRNYHESPLFLYSGDEKPFNIRGNNMFRYIRGVDGRVLLFKKVSLSEDGTKFNIDNNFSFFDLKNGNTVEMEGFKTSATVAKIIKYLNSEYLYCSERSLHFIYNLNDCELVRNFDNGKYNLDDDEIELEIQKYLSKKGTFYDSRTGEPHRIMSEAIKKFLE